MVEWIVVQDFLREWWGLIAIVVVVVGVAIYKQFQKKKEAKALANQKIISARPPAADAEFNRMLAAEQQAQQQVVQPVQKPKDNMSNLFEDKPAVDNQEDIEQDIINKLGALTNVMQNQNVEIERDIVGNVKDIKEAIVEIGNKREQIKVYGLQLSALYEKYGAREEQLATMLIGMEKLASSEKR